MIATHAYSVNGQAWSELQDSFGPPSEELKGLLSRLDGVERYSLILWALPEGKYLDETSPADDAREYLQCAGKAERLVVEIRRIVDGKPQQYVIGRPAGSTSSEADEEVHWSNFMTLVHENEVFDAIEAADLFASYYETGEVPAQYVERPLTL